MALSQRNKEKVFCIGLNKSGTTSIQKIFEEFNYRVGDQDTAERLAKQWFQRDFKSIIKYCHTAQAFQDIPFSLPYTFIALDQYFSKAKFILTVRDSPDQWYKSITKFHSNLWSNGIDTPTIEELKNAKYCYPGFAYDLNRYMFNTPKDDPYNEDILKEFYNSHIRSVIEYFRGKPDKLIVINVSEKQDYERLCSFLKKDPVRDEFPWENKTIQEK